MSARSRRFPALVALLWLAASPAPAAEVLRLAVYHTNDIHGWIMSRPAAWHQADPARPIGGAAALSNRLKTETLPKLVLDGGDWFQGTPEGTLSEGQALVEVFNALGYDALAVGNHDFDLGQPVLEAAVKGLKMPVLGANVYRPGGKERFGLLKPWFIREVAGIKVGVFGLLTTKMSRLSRPQNIAGLEIRREIDEAKEAVRALKAEGATVIIALSHLGFEDKARERFEGDQDLAAAVDGIDLIVGGHSHTFLKKPFRDPVHGTLVVQAGSGLTAVGRVELAVDARTKRVVSSEGRLIDLWTDATGEDPAVLALLAPRFAEADRAYAAIVATSSTDLLRDREAESALGSWVADCYRSETGAEVALQNGGGIFGEIRQGPVTLRRLFTIMPFDDRLVTLELDGRLLREALDHGVGRGHAMIQVSGASFSYDRDAPAGRRVKDVRVGGKPLDPEASYRVATIDFMVTGGDGHSALARAAKKEFTDDLAREALRRCAASQKLIESPERGRMRPLEVSLGAQKRQR